MKLVCKICSTEMLILLHNISIGFILNVLNKQIFKIKSKPCLIIFYTFKQQHIKIFCLLHENLIHTEKIIHFTKQTSHTNCFVLSVNLGMNLSGWIDCGTHMSAKCQAKMWPGVSVQRSCPYFWVLNSTSAPRAAQLLVEFIKPCFCSCRKAVKAGN